jgi:hypothetical protein
MTIIICKVQSGMCNRLVPFLTSYRLAMNHKLKFYLNWDNNCTDTDYLYEGVKTTYNDMFENIDGVNYINDDDMLKLGNNSNVLHIQNGQTNLSKYNINHLLKYDIIYFNKFVHPIFTYEDNVTIDNYSNIKWILDKTDYCKDIQKYFKQLKPISVIQNKIDDVLIKFPEDKNNIIGFHIRHWPNSWSKSSQNQALLNGNHNTRYKIMDDAIVKNKNVKFFISTTDINIIRDLIKRYGDHIIYFEDRFGEKEDDKYYTSDHTNSKGNIYKNQNGVVDLFLLGSCNNIVGDVGSSYSHCAPLLNSNSVYSQVKSMLY